MAENRKRVFEQTAGQPAREGFQPANRDAEYSPNPRDVALIEQRMLEIQTVHGSWYWFPYTSLVNVELQFYGPEGEPEGQRVILRYTSHTVTLRGQALVDLAREVAATRRKSIVESPEGEFAPDGEPCVEGITIIDLSAPEGAV